MSNHYRQGDVLPLKRNDLSIEKLREQAESVSKNRCILAEGEATGHAHRVEEQPRNGESVEMFMLNSQPILYIPESFGPTKVQHEEHAAITLEPGCYEIRQQREYRDGEIRNVMD